MSNARICQTGAEEFVEQDVVGGQGQGLGQCGVEVSGGGQPAVALVPAEFGVHGAGEPGGDVVIATCAAAQQRVEVFQGAGVAADHSPDPFQLGFLQAVQRGQGPDQLEGLGHRQGADVPEAQVVFGAVGQGELVSGGHQQPAAPRAGGPASQ